MARVRRLVWRVCFSAILILPSPYNQNVIKLDLRKKSKTVMLSGAKHLYLTQSKAQLRQRPFAPLRVTGFLLIAFHRFA